MTKLTFAGRMISVGFGDRPTAVNFSGFYRIELEMSMIPRESTSIPSEALGVNLCVPSVVDPGAGIRPCSMSYRCVDASSFVLDRCLRHFVIDIDNICMTS